MTATRRPRRRGASLIETVVVIASVALILSVSGVFLHLVMRVDRAGRASAAEATAVARLARQFRQDVREADSARVVDGRLELPMPDGSAVSFAATDGGVSRTEGAGGKVVRRELYGLPSLEPADLAVEGASARLTLARRPDPRAGGAPRPTLRIEATVGKHLGLARRAGGEVGR
jgi:hypothetical protein